MPSDLTFEDFVDVQAVKSRSAKPYIGQASPQRLEDTVVNGHRFIAPRFLQGSFADASAYVVEKSLVGSIFTTSVAPRWKTHLFSRDASSDFDAISETVESVFEAVSNLGPGSISLQDVSAESVHPEHLVAVLRATFPSRDKIPGWRKALEEAPEALRRAGFDPDEVLVGLR